MGEGQNISTCFNSKHENYLVLCTIITNFAARKAIGRQMPLDARESGESPELYLQL